MHIYMKERYPLVSRLILGLIVFLEIHFIILLNEGVTQFKIGMQEITGAYTVFAFLLWLRIDDSVVIGRMESLAVLYNVVKAREYHAGNCDNSLLVSAALLYVCVLILRGVPFRHDGFCNGNLSGCVCAFQLRSRDRRNGSCLGHFGSFLRFTDMCRSRNL